ncbi:MAG TPA: glycosyltransferase family 4 protein [Elusimicrobiota bacterium]|nr:glycosyltransferase family 4 protein [Elusimicrobiota bacterium]
MNILHVLDEPWDSALTDYALTLGSALKVRGHNVHFACRAGSYALREAEKRGFSRAILGSFLDFRRLLRRRDIELVNAHTGNGHAWAWWGALGRAMALVRTRGDARPLKKNPAHSLIYRRTDAVIGASQCISAQYRSLFGGLADRLWTVYPGLDIPEGTEEPDGPLRIALVGRLDPVKGQMHFLEAVQQLRPQLRDETFLIVGEEKNTPLEELKRLAEHYHVSRWVSFAGRQTDIRSFMKTCHVGVIASVGSESLSRVCLEWMSVGRPVVATAVGCLPELVSTGENGFLVPPGSPQAMASCFLTLIRQKGFRQDLGRRAHAEAKSRFGLDRFAAETEKVYEAARRHRWPVKGKN